MQIAGGLETGASYRRIPIHADLVRLGLSGWVAEKRRCGFTRLFPTAKLDGKSGKGNATSKGFSNLLKAVGIKPTIDQDQALTKELAPILGMHIFRDTPIQAMQGNSSEELRKAYVAHTYEGSRPRAQQFRSSHGTAYMRA